MSPNQLTILGWVCLIAYYIQPNPNFQLIFSLMGFVFFSISIFKRLQNRKK